ncbi:ABC transporter ATP-binding protein [Pedobacter sp. PWIIR3]
MIKAENISKLYQIARKVNNNYNGQFWALRNINFTIDQGEKVALTGHNGAGKSTLLKIISKITAPTTGTISGKGRIISMLEIGTGFHRDLTGIQNIYLNGAMHGMSKKEINKELDSIIFFAEADRQINSPVKHYSSGEYMRLAFSVAAHLRSEILIIDEVMAVGDRDFQKKCAEKLQDTNLRDGRTILSVNHNSDFIKISYDQEIKLSNGMIV